MNWLMKEACVGDIVRVKAGNIYHYGVFVTEEEIIQFGLSPLARVGISDRDVCVCASTVEVFLQGGFLEVGEPDKKERRTLRKPQQIIEIARNRIGEKGYSILYNNCEHFAYECAFGEKYCSQTDRVRALFHSFPILDVYIAAMPDGELPDLSSVHPPERRQAIAIAKSEKVQRERYYVWKLLEYALARTFGWKLKDLQFTQTPQGKWECDKCEFSLSHSHGVLCVALSRKPVGVDIERIAPPPTTRFAEKILCEEELAEFAAIANDAQTEYLIEKWTQKESIFKCLQGEHSLLRINTLRHETISKTLTVDGQAYCLSVASSCTARLRLYENVDLTAH